MPEFDEYINYKPYPGMGPWTLTSYERDVSRDYGISDENLPAESIASRLDIVSGNSPVGAWFGAVIPLPSAFLTGAFSLSVIDLRGRYWNWLTRGYYLLSSSTMDSGYSVPRPATFHYQIGGIYKEVVHYGFDMMILGLSKAIGTIQVVNIVSFVPFLEHRQQCKIKRFFFNNGEISSLTILKDNSSIKISPSFDSEVSISSAIDDASDMNISMTCFYKKIDDNKAESINTKVFKIKSIASDLSFIVDATDSKDDIEKGVFPKLEGAFFSLDKIIQIEDPKTVYTETPFGREYIINSPNGYTTREQEIQARVNSWSKVFYDPVLISDYLDMKSKESETKSKKQTVEADVKNSQEEAKKYAAESKAVSSLKVVYDGKASATNGEKVSVDGYDIVVSEVVLRVLKEVESSSLTIGFDIFPSTLSKHNFGPGTQVGNFFICGVEGAADYSTYKIIDHVRSGVFVMSTTSSTSLKSIYDTLLSKDIVYKISSYNLWKVTDICTNKSGLGAPQNTSLDRGVFDGVVDEVSLVDDGSKKYSLTLKIKFSDRNYYQLDYLKGRYLNDMTKSEKSVDNVICAWKKYYGWRINLQGSERSNSYGIKNISVENDILTITTDKIYETKVDVSKDSYKGNWWISFDELIPYDSPFSYISSAFLGINSFITEAGSDSQIMFNGVYAGSPINLPVKKNVPLRLIENFPVLYSNPSTTASTIKIATSRPYRYVAYARDDADESEYILYERHDDDSRAMCIRKGRMGFKYDIDEYLIHNESSSEIINATVSGEGTTTQKVVVDSNLIKDKDIVSIIVNKVDPQKYPDAGNLGNYYNTLWRIYQGDRLIGIDSSSKKENSIYTREKAKQDSKSNTRDATEIPFYANAEYFTKGKDTEYKICGNTLTGDPLATGGNSYSFIPVLSTNEHSKFKSAKVRVVSSNKVIRRATSRQIFSYNGRSIVYVEQPQSSYLPSGTSEITGVKIVPGTESKRDEENNPPDLSLIDIEQNGVFVFNSTNSFNDFSSGYFSKRNDSEELNKSTMWRYPFLAVPNMFTCSFSKCEKDVDVVGYSYVNEDNESDSINGVFSIVHNQVNLLNSFSNPAFAFYAGDYPVFIWSPSISNKNVIIGTSQINDDIPLFVEENLSDNKMSIASSGNYKILILKRGKSFIWSVSSSDGASWSLYDDIMLTPPYISCSSPSLVVYRDWLFMCYINNKIELRMRKILIPSLVKFHNRYNNKKSSSEEDQKAIKLKEDLQTELNNTYDVKIANTFDQQVSFTIGDDGLLRIVFFNSKGLINAITSTNEGSTWDLSPVNF